MRAILLATALAFCSSIGMPAAHAQQQNKPATAAIKTRLDHFANNHMVLVVSYLPSEITSVTCEKWTMLGIKSYKDRNNFTIPGGPAVAVLDTTGFDGYCSKEGSIVAHTDDGDFPGTLDRGAGNWEASTKLTFSYKAQ